jgi:type 1 glutamine amidotransferase
MTVKSWTAGLAVVGAVILLLETSSGMSAAPATATQPQPRPVVHDNGTDAASVGPGVFAAADRNTDGAVTRAEFKTTLAEWFSAADRNRAGSVSEADLLATVRFPQPRLPIDRHLQAALAALPDRPAAVPRRPRRVLVLNKVGGFVHSPIPLVTRMIEEFGKRTNAWSATATFDPADINEQNLKQYDAIFLNNTTGNFLDDRADPAATAARKKALLDFVRGGKGIAGIHGAADAYHARPAAPGSTAPVPAAGSAPSRYVVALAAQMLAQGERDNDQRLSRQELDDLADAWFDKVDPGKAGSVRQEDFIERLTPIANPPQPPAASPAPAQAAGGRGGAGRAAGAQQDTRVGTWPDFNRMIGGFFKYHWSNQAITVKVDDPKSPLNAMFKGQPHEFFGEIYVFAMDTWSRSNLHVVASVDYSKMSDADKAKEPFPRSDQDYGLVWTRREGQGRVFYWAYGNEERTFYMKPFNEQMFAGLQYALGDLEADDRPSGGRGTK